VVREYRTVTKNGVIGFENFGRNTNKGAEANDIFMKVCEKVVLLFGNELGRIYFCCNV